jgi:hypothetical protein
MKRSENVGLMLMGGAVFAATFAGGMTYMAMQRPSYAAQLDLWRQQFDRREAGAAGRADRHGARSRHAGVGRDRALRLWIEPEKLFPRLRRRLNVI